MLGRARIASRTPVLVAAAVMALGGVLSVAEPALGAPQQASLAIFDDDGGRAMFAGLTLAPDRSYAQCLLVGADAVTDEDWVQIGAADVVGDLADRLEVAVESGRGGRFGDCSGFAGNQIFRGSLAALAAAGGGFGIDTGWRPAVTDTAAFRITVRLDGASQGQSAAGRFVWRVLSDAPPVTDPPSAPASTTDPSGPTTDPSGPTTDPSGPTTDPTPDPTSPSATDDGPSPSPSASGPGTGSSAPAASTTLPPPPPPPPVQPVGDAPPPDVSIGAGVSRVLDLVDRAQRATVALVVRPEYPVTAIVVALLFLLVQDRIDRRDPKLAGVARRRDNEAEFPDRFGVAPISVPRLGRGRR